MLYPVFRFHCPLSGYNWFGSVLCHAFQHNVWNECLWGWCPDPWIKDHWSTLSYSILIFAGLKNHKTNHNWWRNLPVTNQSTGCQIARLEKWAWDGLSILFSKPSTSRLFHLHWTKTRQHQPSKSLKDHLKIMVSRLFHLILGEKKHCPGSLMAIFGALGTHLRCPGHYSAAPAACRRSRCCPSPLAAPRWRPARPSRRPGAGRGHRRNLFNGLETALFNGEADWHG